VAGLAVRERSDDPGLGVGERSDDPGLGVGERSDDPGLAVRERSVAGLAVGERSDDPGLAVRERLTPGRSEVRSPLRPPAGRAAASSQDRRPVPAGARRSRPWPGRVRGPRSKPALPSPGPSSVRRGPSPRNVPVLGPVLRAPAPNGRPPLRLVPSVPARPEVRRAPSPNDRPTPGRDPSRAGGRAVRRAPSAAAGRAVPSGAAGRAGRRAPSLAAGRDARRVPSPPRAVVSPLARSGDDVRVVRRGPPSAGVRGARRAPSGAAPSRPVLSRPVLSRPVLSRPVVSWPARSRPVPRRSPPPRPVRCSCPARPAAVRPRPYAVVPLVPPVPVGRGRLGLFAVPDVVRAVFGMPRPPPVRPLPPAPRPLGVPRSSATPTNLQHPLPQYPDKRRGPLDHIGSDPLQACPAASYSPTRSPAQYHRR
jgi:hypothetical protein